MFIPQVRGSSHTPSPIPNTAVEGEMNLYWDKIDNEGVKEVPA